ncbi:uncharacterized protein ACOB7L_026720 [Callospermophilus lateralis]|uniref:uncharacterized protein LOC143412020 n=1 Tax=Callospermophilus lateralis TaxID=76772 RepID=UPI00403851ED
MAASSSPGPTPSPGRGSPAREPAAAGPSRRQRGRGSYLRTVPSAAAVGSGQSGRPRAAEQVRRGGGYRSALRPIVSLPRGSRRSRAREPGSSPARHLLPPLWKRPPPPRAARPGPRLRAAGPARFTGRRQPSPLRPQPPPFWRGPDSPFPAARARRSRAPAVRALAGCGPRARGRRWRPHPQTLFGRRLAPLTSGALVRGEGPRTELRGIAKITDVCASSWRSRGWLRPERRSTRVWVKDVVFRAKVALFFLFGPTTY